MKYFTRTITTYTYKFAKTDGQNLSDVTEMNFTSKLSKSAKAKLMESEGFNVNLGMTEVDELRRMSLDVFLENSEPVSLVANDQ